jgi:hypothetical protein
MVICHLEIKKLLLEITALRTFLSDEERMEENCIIRRLTFSPLHLISFVSISDGTDDFGGSVS